jgi:hypothetical protein
MTEETTTTYSTAAQDWDYHRAALAAEQTRHEAAVDTINAALREAERVMAIVERAGLLVGDAYVTARGLLEVQWHPTRADGATRAKRRTPEVTACFRDAEEALRHRGERLTRGYLGVKAYDRRDSQRADCDYGMGPSHGHIWFRIGLRSPRRPLTEEQALACLHWLRAVEADPDGMLG